MGQAGEWLPLLGRAEFTALAVRMGGLADEGEGGDCFVVLPGNDEGPTY